MCERVIGFAWVLAITACGEPPREDGPSPFGDADTDVSGDSTTSGDGTTEDPLPDVTTSPTGSGPDPVTSAGPSEDSGTTAAVDPDSGSSSSEPGSSGGSSSSTGGFDTTNDGTLMVEVSVQSMWPTGECDDVTVTNVSDEVVVWEIELELPGTITMIWNTTWSEMDGIGTFAGVDFNASLDPGAAAMFGFCVEY